MAISAGSSSTAGGIGDGLTWTRGWLQVSPNQRILFGVV